MNRFKNGVSRTDLYWIAEMFVDTFIQSFSESQEGIILNIDDTDYLTHGFQQLRLFGFFHRDYCYMYSHL
ncbi:MAG: transposase [Candidatus Aminicenantaceae bacterium]